MSYKTSIKIDALLCEFRKNTDIYIIATLLKYISQRNYFRNDFKFF